MQFFALPQHPVIFHRFRELFDLAILSCGILKEAPVFHLYNVEQDFGSLFTLYYLLDNESIMNRCTSLLIAIVTGLPPFSCPETATFSEFGKKICHYLLCKRCEIAESCCSPMQHLFCSVPFFNF